MFANPKFTLITKNQRLLSATVSANIAKYDQNTAYTHLSTQFSIVTPKIMWAWHFRINTVAGFHRSDIWTFRIDLAWIKKRGANQSDVIKNSLLPYEISSEQSGRIKNVSSHCGSLISWYMSYEPQLMTLICTRCCQLLVAIFGVI